MHKLRRQTRFLPLLAAVALLTLQIAASAHEIEHALEQHAEPTCALHLYCSNAGKPEIAQTGVPLAVVVAIYATARVALALETPLLLAYRGRAPPPLPNAA